MWRQRTNSVTRSHVASNSSVVSQYDACTQKLEHGNNQLVLPLFQNKNVFGLKLRYEIKVTIGEISLKLRQTNWNVARNNVNVVADKLPSQITFYTFLTIEIWIRRR
jgi:hypothetical protein